MNVNALLEKQQLECTEGLNHLLIHIDASTISGIKNFRMDLSLPEGISAHKNLNNFPENERHEVTIPEIHEDTDLIFEFVTEGELPLGQLFIDITSSYVLHGKLIKCKKYIPLMIVSEEMSDQIVPDPEIVSRVAKLKNDFKQESEQYSFVILPAQEIENGLSPLEKRYRIQGLHEVY